MNVRELIDELENYGDHVPVAVIRTVGNKERSYTDLNVEDRTLGGEMVVGIEVED